MPERVELMIGKSHDSHGPIGPWIVTSDEISDPHKLDLKCYVNGELRQSSNTDDMIWNCYEQIEYLSSAMTLKPGDLIITGTPRDLVSALEGLQVLPTKDVRETSTWSPETL